jgi:predicted porin
VVFDEAIHNIRQLEKSINNNKNSNQSIKIKHNNEDTGDGFNTRWADLTLASKRYGKIWLGRGDTASDKYCLPVTKL